MLKAIDIIKVLNKHRVKYLIYGAWAGVAYGIDDLITFDVDILIEPTMKNIEKLSSALSAIGITDFMDIFRRKPVEIVLVDMAVDIHTNITPELFDQLWQRKEQVVVEGVRVKLMSLKDIINFMEKYARPKDKIHIEKLKCLLKLIENRRKR